MIEGDWGPAKAEFDDRVKRAGQRFVLAHSVVPAVATVAYGVAGVVGPANVRPTMLMGAAAGLVAVWALVAWARAQALRPHRWVSAATWCGGIAGFCLAAPIAALLGFYGEESASWPAGRVVGVGCGVIAGGLLLGVFVPRSLARQAERLVLEPFGDALARSAVEVSFRAKAGRTTVVTADEIVLTATTKRPLADVRRAVPRTADGIVEVTFDGGEQWLVPTERPERLVQLLQARSDRSQTVDG